MATPPTQPGVTVIGAPHTRFRDVYYLFLRKPAAQASEQQYDTF